MCSSWKNLWLFCSLPVSSPGPHWEVSGVGVWDHLESFSSRPSLLLMPNLLGENSTELVNNGTKCWAPPVLISRHKLDQVILSRLTVKLLPGIPRWADLCVYINVKTTQSMFYYFVHKWHHHHYFYHYSNHTLKGKCVSVYECVTTRHGLKGLITQFACFFH